MLAIGMVSSNQSQFIGPYQTGVAHVHPIIFFLFIEEVAVSCEIESVIEGNDIAREKTPFRLIDAYLSDAIVT